MKKNKQKKKIPVFTAVMLIVILLFATSFVSSDCAPTQYPSGKSGHSMVYDSINDVIIIYGGTTYKQWAYMKYDTKAYDYNDNNWIYLNPSGTPYQSSWGAMAYDSESDRVILVGGWEFGDGGVHQDETWAFDYNTKTWENMNPITMKPYRIAHQMAYDAESDLVILFGGLMATDLSVLHNTIYTYDYNTNNWTVLPSDLCPTTENIFYFYPTLVFTSIIVVIFQTIRRKK